MEWHVNCPKCEKNVRIRSEDISDDPDCFPEWEEQMICEHCGHNFIVNFEITVEVTAYDNPPKEDDA